jgi:hypothetical protein
MMTSGAKSTISCTCRSGHAAGDRHHGAAESLGAVVRAESTGEQPIAVRDVHHHPRPPAGRADRARHDVGPGVDVALRVSDDRRLAGRTARAVDAHDLLARHREHPERVRVAQVLLARERELREVLEGAAVVRVDTVRVERLAVERDVVVRVPQRPPQPLQLQRGELVARRGLDRGPAHGDPASGHACRPLWPCRPRLMRDAYGLLLRVAAAGGRSSLRSAVDE